MEHLKLYRIWMTILITFTPFSANVEYTESEAVCRQYATAAVSDFRQNEALGCRFANARWQSNYDAHFNWCRTAPSQLLKNEAEFRGNQLRVCRRDPQAVACNRYAIGAFGDQQSNLSGRCGFTGQRWQDNDDEHLRWCLQAPVGTADSEHLNSVTLYGGIFALSDTLYDRMAFLPNEKLRT